MARQLQELTFEASVVRNVHLYRDDGANVGGIYQNGILTYKRLYYLCPHFLEFSPPDAQWAIFTLNNNNGSTGQKLPDDRTHLAPGQYIILAPDGSPVAVNPSSESHPRRILSEPRSSRLTPRREYFRKRVRTRDKGCVISGTPNPRAAINIYRHFEAAHIFPQAREAYWNANHFSQFVTDMSPASSIGLSKIHSPQNGLLIDKAVHSLFDDFEVSVNPDDHYLIFSFTPDTRNLDGRVLDFRCRDPRTPDRVSDDLLRWHFRMAILANMKGAAIKPSWETDFPEGDMMGEIMEMPDAAERMEEELFHRLGPGEEIHC